MRCYEAYCYFKNKLDEECKSERTMQRVNKYVEFMETKNVKFDRSVGDKALFVRLQKKLGTEKAVTQPSLVTQPKLYRCGFPGCQKGAYYPIFYDDIPVCPDCDKKIQDDPSLAEKLGLKPTQPQRTEKKEYKLKPTWEERKAAMHPRVSKMEDAIRLRLEEAKIPFQAQHEFCIVQTIPDFYFPAQGLAVYLDGEKVHRKREAKDEFLREKLQSRHNIRAVGIVYKDNSKLSEDEIFEKLVREVKGDTPP